MVTNDCIYEPYKSYGRCAYGNKMIILWGKPLKYNEHPFNGTVGGKLESGAKKLVDKDLIWW